MKKSRKKGHRATGFGLQVFYFADAAVMPETVARHGFALPENPL
jgi:hypothetical protein